MKQAHYSFLFFILLLNITANAQTYESNQNKHSSVSPAQQTDPLVQKGDVWLGIKGGLSIPNLQAGESKNAWNKNYKSIVRAYFSVFGEYQFNQHFSLQAEIAYAAQGGKRTDIQPFGIPEEYVSLFQQAFNTSNDYVFANLNSTSHINFLQVPILLKYSYPIALKKRLSIYGLIGPYVGYMLSAQQIVQSPELRVFVSEDEATEIAPNLVHGFFGSSIDTTINSYPELNHFNLGIQGGIGFSYQLKHGKLFIEGGGNYGFLYLQKGNEHGKNNIGAGTVLVGYSLNLRK